MVKAGAIKDRGLKLAPPHHRLLFMEVVVGPRLLLLRILLEPHLFGAAAAAAVIARVLAEPRRGVVTAARVAQLEQQARSPEVVAAQEHLPLALAALAASLLLCSRHED